MKQGGSRDKGARGERELSDLLTIYAREVGITLKLSRNLDQTRDGGHDLKGLEQWGLAVEVKRVETPAIAKWWQQAVRQADAVNCQPVLAYRQNRHPWRFRITATVPPANDPLTIDLDAENFKKWFISVLTLK